VSCRGWEERIALHAGGDLAEGAAEVERHLAECAACRALLGEVRGSLAELRAAHAQEIPAAAYTALRTRVMAEVGRAGIRRWAWEWAAAAAVAIVLAAVGAKHEMRVEPLPVVALAPPAVIPRGGSGPGMPGPYRNGGPAPHAGTGHARSGMPPHKRRPETILVKLETGNPDVVIYWIAETKGEE
jgi:hypothetical protein